MRSSENYPKNPLFFEFIEKYRIYTPFEFSTSSNNNGGVEFSDGLNCPMSYQYAYIAACFCLFFFWSFLFARRKDLRKEMLWASLVGLPFGFTELFYVPEYWIPDSLFDLIRTYGFGIESFLYSFFTAGIAAVVYEFFAKKRVVKIPRDVRFHYLPLVMFTILYLGFELLFSSTSIYNISFAFAVGAAVTIYLRKDLLWQVLFSGGAFGFLYFLLFATTNVLFRDFVTPFYAVGSLLGLRIAGVPFEEILFATTGGAFWSTLYEYTKAYRTR